MVVVIKNGKWIQWAPGGTKSNSLLCSLGFHKRKNTNQKLDVPGFIGDELYECTRCSKTFVRDGFTGGWTEVIIR